MIDSHCHLHICKAREEDLLERAARAGLSGLLQVGSDLDSSRRNLGLAARRDLPLEVRISAGLHPGTAKDFHPALAGELRALLAGGGYAAVGETGLDAHWTRDLAAEQERLFRLHVELALAHDLPLVVHSREAASPMLALLRSYAGDPRLRGVWHCFDGSVAEATEAFALGFVVSLSGIITYPNARALQETVRSLPEDRLLVETDSPYLSPVPLRGRPNEPAHLPHLLDFLARLRGVPAEGLGRALRANTARLFGFRGAP